jgi:hypothetical protein
MLQNIKPTIEIHRMLNVIEKQFDNDVWLREIIQNSYRAGATNIEIQNHDNKIVIYDNGKGIQSTLEWTKLLETFGSGWNEEIQSTQNPAGLGIFATLLRFPCKITSHENEICYTPKEVKKLNSPKIAQLENPIKGTIIEITHNLSSSELEEALIKALEAWDKALNGESIQLKLNTSLHSFSGEIRDNPYASPLLLNPQIRIQNWTDGEIHGQIQTIDSPIVKIEGCKIHAVTTNGYDPHYNKIHVLSHGNLIEIQRGYEILPQNTSLIISLNPNAPIDLKLPDRTSVIKNQKFKDFLLNVVKPAVIVINDEIEKATIGAITGLPFHYPDTQNILKPAHESSGGEIWHVSEFKAPPEANIKNGVWTGNPFNLQDNDWLIEPSQNPVTIELLQKDGTPQKIPKNQEEFEIPSGNLNLWIQSVTDKKNVFWVNNDYGNSKARSRQPLKGQNFTPWAGPVLESIVLPGAIILEIRELGLRTGDENVTIDTPKIFRIYQDIEDDFWEGLTLIGNPAFKKCMEESPKEAFRIYKEFTEKTFRNYESGEEWKNQMNYYTLYEYQHDLWQLKEVKEFLSPTQNIEHVEGFIKTILHQCSKKGSRLINNKEKVIVKKMKFTKAQGLMFSVTIQSKTETLKIEYNEQKTPCITEELTSRK